MKKLDVKIVELPPLKAVKFYGYSETPEMDAGTSAGKWLKKHNLLKPDAYRSLGFNNPNPSQGTPKYGYEIWIIPAGETPEDPDAEQITFPGGLYAVAYCPRLNVIGEIWQKLVAWRESSEYSHGAHQWLEEVIQPWQSNKEEELQFYLYLPIKK